MSAPLDDFILRNPGSLIRRAHQIATSLFLDECSSFGVTPLQFAVLWTANKHRGLDQTSLARSVGLDRTTTARVVRNLEQNGLMRRRTDPRDRRTKRLHITKEGTARVEAMSAAVKRARERIVEPLAPDEREKFLGLLAKLVDANNEHSRAPVGEQRLADRAIAETEPWTAD